MSNEPASSSSDRDVFIDRAVGIDLGTTNSEVAILDPSERDLVVYADKFGRKTVPSAVSWDETSETFFVGRAARNRRGSDQPPVESIKRRMGTDKSVELGPHQMSPEEVSAKILAELRTLMSAHLQDGAPAGIDVRVTRGVITVPAYFDAPQVEATRRAGELAGLEVLGVLQEPTAAAIYHTWRHSLGDGNFLVYDLGGGTFDVSVLRCIGGEYQVLAIDGDNFLGGDDFDRRFADRLREQLVEKGYALDLDVAQDAEDASRFMQLVHLAQEIKESLSTRDVLLVNKPDVLVDKEGEKVAFEGEIGRAEYNAAVADLIETTLVCCERAIARSKEVADVGAADIDHVILVGGSTRVPAVVQAVQERICAPANVESALQEDVDTCVALGAAVHAAQLGGIRLGIDKHETQPASSVLIRSPLVAKADLLKMKLEVEEAPDGVSALAISDAEGPLADVEFNTVPSGELRLEVPLGDEAEQPVTLQLLGEDQNVRVALPMALYRGDLRPRASALSKPSVIAKDIALEVVRAGRRDRKVLIERGVGLPTTAQHQFFTTDQSGAVVLRLLQGRLPIKTLVVNVPSELEVGTPVDLTISCDEAMRLEARANVAGQELWASIEPAQLEVPASVAAVELLLEEAETTRRRLWGREQSAFSRELDPLLTNLREVLRTDPDKAAALTGRLVLLVEEFRDSTGEGLTPPMHRFEGLLNSLRRVVYRSDSEMLGMNQEQWEARIEAVAVKGQAAWDGKDAGAWRRAYNEAQALLETASEREFAQKKLDDPAYVMRRVSTCVSWSVRLERALSDFEPSSAMEIRALQIAERDRLLSTLRQEVAPILEVETEAPVAEVRRRVDTASAELERVEIALERLPQMGLVTERG